MYGKLGRVLEAEIVFIGLSKRNIVSWNAMLTAYIERAEVEKALLLYRQMQDENVGVDEQTFVIIIQSSGILVQLRGRDGHMLKEMPLEIGKALHCDAWKKGFSLSVIISNTLMSMYGKCGSSIEAEMVFMRLVEHNVVTCNSMLSAYVDQGQGEKAIKLFRQMKVERVIPDQRTFVITLQACCDLFEKENGMAQLEPPAKMLLVDLVRALHAEVRRQQLSSDGYVCSSLVTLYGKCGSILEAENVFDSLYKPNIVSWNALLSAYLEQGQTKKTVQLYLQMQEEGMSLSSETFLIVLQACAGFVEKVEACAMGLSYKRMALEIGKALHDDIHRNGLTSDDRVANTLVTLYGKCGNIEDAENVFAHLVDQDVVSWTSMLSAYAEQGEGDKAFQLYENMRGVILLNDVTMLSIMQACCETGNLEMCLQLHFISIVAGYDAILLLINTLIRAYGSCACMADAQAVFDGVCRPDVISWSSCIAGYAQTGNNSASLQMFDEMQAVGELPDEITFYAVLSACNYVSLMDEGSRYFESMHQWYSATAKSKHYAILTDLLGRVGNFQKVEDFLLGMPIQPALSVWLCLLGACRIHGHVDLGKVAFDNALSFCPEDAAMYVFMSNIYAVAGLMELV